MSIKRLKTSRVNILGNVAIEESGSDDRILLQIADKEM